MPRDPLLTVQQVGALSKEIDDAAGLFSYGLAILRRLDTSARDSSAVFATLSTGAEKLLKLALGLTALEEAGAWPSRRFMREQMRHRILEMDQAVRAALRRRRDHGTAPGHMDRALVVLDNDPILAPMLSALDRYADQGRFYNLDRLADAPDLRSPPSELWEETMHRVFDRDQDALTLIAQPETYRVGRGRMNALVADSLQRWWQTNQRGWTTGVLGWRGQMWSGPLNLFDIDRGSNLPMID